MQLYKVICAIESNNDNMQKCLRKNTELIQIKLKRIKAMQVIIICS